MLIRISLNQVNIKLLLQLKDGILWSQCKQKLISIQIIKDELIILI